MDLRSVGLVGGNLMTVDMGQSLSLVVPGVHRVVEVGSREAGN